MYFCYPKITLNCILKFLNIFFIKYTVAIRFFHEQDYVCFHFFSFIYFFMQKVKIDMYIKCDIARYLQLFPMLIIEHCASAQNSFFFVSVFGFILRKVGQFLNFLYLGPAERYYFGIYLHSDNWGSVFILLSNGATKSTFLHLNLTLV